MPLVDIKKSSIDDVEEILRLQKQSYLSEAELYNDYGIKPLTQTLDDIKQDFSKQIFLKAVTDDNTTIVGSVKAYQQNDTVFIGRLAVDPKYQNKGIGAKLMISIEEIVESAKRFELFTGHKSVKNIYLYQKLGYREFKRIPINDSLTMVYLEKFKIQNI
jgi:ribosomal protein S18 acetylase RimI-like enzyme